MKATEVKKKIFSPNLKMLGFTVTLLLGFTAQASYAERIRFCNFSMTDTLRLVDFETGETITEYDVTLIGDTAGRHGGVKPNEARKRARNRFIDCRNNWIAGDGTAPSANIENCNNANVREHLRQDEDLETLSGGDTHTDYLVKAFAADICPIIDSHIEAVLTWESNTYQVTGNVNCGASGEIQSSRFLGTSSTFCAY